MFLWFDSFLGEHPVCIYQFRFSGVTRVGRTGRLGAMIGESASCTWRSLRTLLVVPSYGGYLLPGDALELRVGWLWVADGSARISGVVYVESPAVPT